MKILRKAALTLIGLSLSAPAAFACDPPNGSFYARVYHINHPDSDFDRDDHDCDHHDRDCDHERDSHARGGHDCTHDDGGTTTTGSGTGDTTPPVSPKS